MATAKRTKKKSKTLAKHTPKLSAVRSWEKQATEPDRAYAAFVYYRDLPATNRTLQQVSKALGLSAEGLLREWSQKFDWDTRCVKWDAHLQRRFTKVKERTRANMARRHAKMAQNGQIAVALLQKKVNAKLMSCVDTLDELDKADLKTLLRIMREANAALPILVNIEKTAEGLADVKVEVETKETVRAVTEVEELLSKHPELAEAFDKFLGD